MKIVLYSLKGANNEGYNFIWSGTKTNNFLII